MNKEDMKIGDFVFAKLEHDDYYIGIVEASSLNFIWCEWNYIGKDISKITINDFYKIKNKTMKPLRRSIVHKFENNAIYFNNESSIVPIDSNNNVRGHGFFYYVGEDLNPYKSMNEAKEQEFKVEKLSTEKKVTLLLCKLENLIDEALENNNQSKFNLYSGRYNKIKNKYSKVVMK